MCTRKEVFISKDGGVCFRRQWWWPWILLFSWQTKPIRKESWDLLISHTDPLYCSPPCLAFLSFKNRHSWGSINECQLDQMVISRPQTISCHDNLMRSFRSDVAYNCHTNLFLPWSVGGGGYQAAFPMRVSNSVCSPGEFYHHPIGTEMVSSSRPSNERCKIAVIGRLRKNSFPVSGGVSMTNPDVGNVKFNVPSSSATYLAFIVPTILRGCRSLGAHRKIEDQLTQLEHVDTSCPFISSSSLLPCHFVTNTIIELNISHPHNLFKYLHLY